MDEQKEINNGQHSDLRFRGFNCIVPEIVKKRNAAAGFLSGDSEVPIILDEPFAMYDEKRLESALRILSGSARQVILFTCQSRELDMLSNMGLA